MYFRVVTPSLWELLRIQTGGSQSSFRISRGILRPHTQMLSYSDFTSLNGLSVHILNT